MGLFMAPAGPGWGRHTPKARTCMGSSQGWGLQEFPGAVTPIPLTSNLAPVFPTGTHPPPHLLTSFRLYPEALALPPLWLPLPQGALHRLEFHHSPL